MVRRHLKISLRFLLVAICVLFAGCSHVLQDENGCFRDFESAVTSSKKTEKDIIIIVTMENDDEQSAAFLNTVVRNADFSSITDKFSVVLMDFSQKTYENTVVKEDFDKKQAKTAQENQEILGRNSMTAMLLNISLTPAFFLFTKDGCFAAEMEFTEDISSPSGFLALAQKYAPLAENVRSITAQASTGTREERVSALERLYEQTDALYRPFLKDYINQAVKLTSQAASGTSLLHSKFLVAQVDAESTKSFLAGDYEAAVQGYVKLTENKNLSAEYRQQAWYMAAYLLAMSDPSRYDLILQYFQNAVAAAPDSPDAASIQRAIDSISGK